MSDHDLSFLHRLHCPYCGSGLVVDTRVGGAAGERFTGILRCACYRYPVLYGIPILRQTSPVGTNEDPIVQRILGGDVAAAIGLATGPLQLARKPEPGRVRKVLARFQPHAEEAGEGGEGAPLWKDGAFRSTLYALKPRLFADYLYFRHANHSFMSATILISLLREISGVGHSAGLKPVAEKPAVLDLSCGIGHTSFLIGALFPELDVMAVDHDFGNLRLAQQYMAPHAKFVCLDAELPLPFADGTFAACLGLDGLHYIRSKVALIRELDRVMQPEALWLFPHLHNARQLNVAPGVPLSPEHWDGLFEFIPHRIMPESRLVHQFADEDACDLGATLQADQLDASPSLAIVATRRKDFWRRHHGLSDRLASLAEELRLNPVLEQSGFGASARLESHWPTPELRAECAVAREVMPEELVLSENQSKQLAAMQAASEQPDAIRELIRRFVVVALPPGYRSGPATVDRTRP